MHLRWIATLVLACTLSAVSSAQPPAPDAGIIGIGHIAYRASDFDREIAFLGKLGFEQSFVIANDGKPMEAFVKINDRQFFEIYAQTNPAQPLGWMHVCYEAGDLNALYKFLAEGGLKPSAVRKAGAGNLISSTNDPDGRVTEFTQYMPGSRHTLDRGQHLGAHRVATELLGFNLTAANFVAEKQFFIDLGFEAQEAGANVRFTALGAPGLHIELLPARRGLQPQVLFPVADARQTEKQLKEAGLAAERNGRLVFVRDPDGNAFVFLETGAKNK